MLRVTKAKKATTVQVHSFFGQFVWYRSQFVNQYPYFVDSGAIIAFYLVDKQHKKMLTYYPLLLFEKSRRESV